MALSQTLASAAGLYTGAGDGDESGPFVARIDVSKLPNGGAMLRYLARSDESEVLHVEQTMLVAGPDGRDRLYIAHSESPFVTEMTETEPDSGRFAQSEPFGPYQMEVKVEVPEPGRLIYGWWWAEDGGQLLEQSRADVRLLSKVEN